MSFHSDCVLLYSKISPYICAFFRLEIKLVAPFHVVKLVPAVGIHYHSVDTRLLDSVYISQFTLYEGYGLFRAPYVGKSLIELAFLFVKFLTAVTILQQLVDISVV